MSSLGSRMASRSSNDMTSATRSGSTANAPGNRRGNDAANTPIMTMTIGATWIRKSLKVKPARLAMMMLGGSPINVAVPPMFDANASAIKNGAGPMASRSQTSSVTGAISNTVVTLSNKADANAVTSTSRIMMRSEEPWARLAAQIAGVFEDTGLPQYADDDHHAQQQKEDVPIDSGVAGVEYIVGIDHRHGDHDRRARQGDQRLVDAFAGDQRIGDHEHDDRDDAHQIFLGYQGCISASVPPPAGVMP